MAAAGYRQDFFSSPQPVDTYNKDIIDVKFATQDQIRELEHKIDELEKDILKRQYNGLKTSIAVGISAALGIGSIIAQIVMH